MHCMEDKCTAKKIKAIYGGKVIWKLFKFIPGTIRTYQEKKWHFREEQLIKCEIN